MAAGRDSKFYVVGGPVQPDRACYMSRDADDLLLRRLLDGDYCHVLAQRNTGKTSLAAHTAWNLRDRDVRVAVVDLTQLKLDEPEHGAGRWYYSIAYRIVRDLRLKSDMQTWWSEHSGLTHAQRLAEFFFEVVLAETEHRYVIFVDRLEVIAGQPHGEEFLQAVRDCYDARANESDFQRLTFCLLGTGTPEEYAKNIQDSPFGISANVPLGDFRRSEISALAGGLGSEGVELEQVVSRIWWWTRGHPYLTQKLFRGLSRRSDELIDAETVDDLVATQFLGATATEQEAHLSFVASRLLQQNSSRVARLSLYGKICKGGDVVAQSSSRPQRELLAAGVVVEDASGNLVLRNNIYAEVFSARWVNQNLPFGWRRLGVAAAVVALLIAIPVWYINYLPRPYERALSGAAQDYQVALDAYESLSFFPGYGDRANQLFGEFLVRQSLQADTLESAMRAHNRLLQLPESEEVAANALSGFWDRHSNALALSGKRDAALLAQLNALSVPSDVRRRLAASLIGDDYRQLLGTIRIDNLLTEIRTDAESSRLTILDDQHLVHFWQLQGDAAPAPLGSLELVAEERVQLPQRLIISAPLNTERLELSVTTDHPRPADVQVSLRAPSGAAVTLSLEAADNSGPSNEYRFSSTAYPELAALLGDDASGTWIASFSDRERGATGFLIDWTLSVPGGSAAAPEDADRSAVVIPEPVLTTLVRSRLDEQGQRALVWPEDDDVRGDVLVWDLGTTGVVTRLPRDSGFIDAQFVMGGAAVLMRNARLLALHDTVNGNKLGEIAAATDGSAPVLSSNGRYLVLTVEREDGSSGYQVHDTATLAPVGQVVSAENAQSVAVDGQGYYLAVGGRDRIVRIWSLRDATLFREFSQAGIAQSLAFDPLGRWLVSEDQSYNLRVWEVAGGRNFPTIERTGREPWQFTFSTDSSRMLLGSGGRAYDVISLPQGWVTGTSLRHPATEFTPTPALAPRMLEANALMLTHDGRNTAKLWRAPVAVAAGEPAATATVSQGALSPDGKRIALGAVDGGVRVLPFDTEQGVLVPAVTEAGEVLHTSAIHRIEFNPGGSLLASGSTTGEVRLWNALSGAPLEYSVRHLDEAILDLKFSADGKLLVSASQGLVVVSDVVAGERLAEYRVSGGEAAIALVPDEPTVLIASAQAGVVIWDWQQGSQQQLLAGGGAVNQAVAAGDQRVVTAGLTGELRLWDRATGDAIGPAVFAPGAIDQLWTFAETQVLVVRSGHWIQGYMIDTDGIKAQRSLLLPETTAAIQPDPVARVARVLTGAHSSRPSVLTMSLDAEQVAPLEGNIAELQTEWRRRLAYDALFGKQIDQ